MYKQFQEVISLAYQTFLTNIRREFEEIMGKGCFRLLPVKDFIFCHRKGEGRQINQSITVLVGGPLPLWTIHWHKNHGILGIIFYYEPIFTTNVG